MGRLATKEMTNERILITGAAGSIGSELVRQLAATNTVYGLDMNESGIHDVFLETDINYRVGDIRDYDTVNDVFSDIKPSVVFHAAAYKHVTPMELTPIEAIKTNIIGTYNLTHCARRWEVKKFVFISTDKAIHSNSVMGATKRVGEIMVKNQGKGFVVVRFGNVLGSRGSVIPIWERQINSGLAVTVTDPNMTRYMMTIKEACELVIEAGERGEGGEIMILDMGNPIKIIDLAERIIAETRPGTEIKITGRQPGETMHEKLMLDEEKAVAIKDGRFFIIKNSI
jgi:FlaA1/EpsC-like NDP-sugar epimerase